MPTKLLSILAIAILTGCASTPERFATVTVTDNKTGKVTGKCEIYPVEGGRSYTFVRVGVTNTVEKATIDPRP